MNEFIHREILVLSINAGFQTRGKPVYAEGVSGAGKRAGELKCRIRNLLRAIGTRQANAEFSNPLPVIERFRKTISDEFSDILAGNMLRLGVAQKIVNLYLKYLWCLEETLHVPQHCPFDNRIIERLSRKWKRGTAQEGEKISNTNWTEMEEPADYKRLARAARDVASGRIAKWELKLWNRLNSGQTKQCEKSGHEG